MNIFILDQNPIKAAEYHCDKHVVKMILESAQMLSTVHHIAFIRSKNLDISDFKGQKKITEYCKTYNPFANDIYSVSHLHHPCTVWSYESLENYIWHSALSLSLCMEYTKRYKKIHKSQPVLKILSNNLPSLPTKGLTPFAIAMKPEFKISNDPVECYRNYYLKDKVRFAKWNYTEKPDWWI
jgi:hypothetical protein